MQLSGDSTMRNGCDMATEISDIRDAYSIRYGIMHTAGRAASKIDRSFANRCVLWSQNIVGL